ncbi:BcpO-related WXXGXW repeat protein [Mucilaginibacter sp. HC2]|uniref:YXWGXW repeat-containing protein n=1 Tax=Mucilaginibacter inviolabilis TaxID=2714892 RepID=UPI00140A8856|nr:YXWGXW repeat-containing protein [Mucilaginibacter inviolabilis]NHA06950.1 BcpO-related WXXGXW repeat protein [Mucilaginibacter inviolabilis]
MKKILKSFVLLAAFTIVMPQVYAQVSVGISISAHIAPPALPVYTQPVCPGDGYIWTPGYWAYADPDGYYWVPGVWVRPPHVGVLWTPAYWGYAGGVYGFHAGYWGPHVGFYGGVNYGFGYGGVGFGGGVWAGNVFRYNTAVANVNTTVIHNTYVNKTVINNNTTINNRTSFNGPGGVNANPNEQERRAMNENHIQPTSNQMDHQQTASRDHNQFASVNHGAPATTAMNRVNGRSFNQQGRIANGISSGKLNAGETKNLENREANLNKEVRTDRADNGGHLTGQERNQVNNQQNKLSNAIDADKHNANNANYGNNEVGQRRANQQQRIAQGIRNGQMNARQAARTENREQNINRNINADRRANDGRLTAQQHRQINHQQNRASRQISHQRHG